MPVRGPIRVPDARVPELRAAVRAFAQAPGPARFHRVLRLLDDLPEHRSRRGRAR